MDQGTHPPPLSTHAQQRCAQRGVSAQVLAWTLRYGHRYRYRHAWHIVLRRCDAPPELRRAMEQAHAFGTVVVEEEGRTLTVYRNEDAPSAVRRSGRPRRRRPR